MICNTPIWRNFYFTFSLIWLISSGQVFACENHSVFKKMERVSKKSELALGKVDELKSTFLKNVNIQKPRIEEMSVSGSTKFGSQTTDLLLQQMGKASNRGWVLVLQLPDTQMSQLIPGLDSSRAGDLMLMSPTVIFSQATVDISTTSLSKQQKPFFEKLLRKSNSKLTVQKGINLITSVQVKQGTELDRQMKFAKIDIPDLLLQGVVLKDFDADKLSEAKKNGTLIKQLAHDSELRAIIPGFRIKTLPRNCTSGQASLVVTGQPSIGIQFDMTMDSDGNRRDFECQLAFSQSDTKAAKIAILAKSKGDELWKDALGIQGVTLQAAQLKISIDSQQRAGIETKAKMLLGPRTVNVLGGAEFHAVSGALLRSYFRGKMDRLTSRDLAAVANAVTGKLERGKINTNGLPDFELRDLEFTFAPLGGSDDLGIETGYKMKGDLFVDGSKFASCNVLIDQSKTDPVVSIKANAGTIRLGDLEVRNTRVNVRMAESDSFYMLKGTVKLLDTKQTVDILINEQVIKMEFDGKLGQKFNTHFVYRAKNTEKPAWSVSAKIRGQLDLELENKLSKNVSNYATAKAHELNELNERLQELQQRVNSLESKIDKARQDVIANRRARQQQLSVARNKVSSIQRRIDSLRSQIIAERQTKLAGVKSKLNSASSAMRSLKSKSDKAYDAYQKANRAYKKAKSPFDKAKKKAKMLKAKATYEVARRKYSSAKAIYDKAKSAYDSVAKGVNRIPVDADPRILAAKGELKVAESALNAASQAISQLDRIPVDSTPKVKLLIESKKGLLAQIQKVSNAVQSASQLGTKFAKITNWDPKNGSLVSINGIKFEAKLSGLESASQIELEVDAKVAGSPKSLRIKVDSSMLTSDRLAETLVDELTRNIF